MVVTLIDAAPPKTPPPPAPEEQQPGLPTTRAPAQPLPPPVRLNTGKEIATLEVRGGL